MFTDFSRADQSLEKADLAGRQRARDNAVGPSLGGRLYGLGPDSAVHLNVQLWAAFPQSLHLREERRPNHYEGS